MRQYAAALDGVKAQATDVGAGRTVAGTVNGWLRLTSTPVYLAVQDRCPETQRTRRNILENFREAHGDKPVFRTEQQRPTDMLLKREHVQRIVNEKAGTPFAQRNFLNTLRAMFKWAAKEGRVPNDPTLGVTREKVKTTGYKTCSEDQIARFESAHPIGVEGAARLRAPPVHRPAPQRRREDGAADTSTTACSPSTKARPKAAKRHTSKSLCTPSCKRSSTRRRRSA